MSSGLLPPFNPRRARLEGPEPPLDLGDTGRDLFAATEPVAFDDPNQNWAWARFMAALSLHLDVISEMVRDDADGNEGWTKLANPRLCPTPFLRVLAQWAGIKRWDAFSEEDLRALIGPRSPGMWRGTRAAMIAAVRRLLGPDEELYFEERADGRPYWLRIFTYDFGGTVRPSVAWGDLLGWDVAGAESWGSLRDRTWEDITVGFATWQDLLEIMAPGAGYTWGGVGNEWGYWYELVWGELNYDVINLFRTLYQVKPGGLILVYEVRNSQQWSRLRDSGLDWGELPDHYQNWDEIRRNAGIQPAIEPLKEAA